MRAAVAVGALVAGAIAPATSQVPGIPAQVVDFEPPTRVESYKITDFGRSASARDDRSFKQKFLVAERTGNCCENYITISDDGRLFDIGGRYVNFTDDNGKTWRSVQPVNPIVNGEGTMALAPNGDVIVVEWDPYSGDHLIAYKYDAEGEAWSYLESPMHTPFYDRPWLTVVPGPVQALGGEAPYVSFVDGFPHAGAFLMSTDGLTYAQASSPFVDEQRGAQSVEGWVPTKPHRMLDWIQPNSNSPIVPLGGGRALAPPDAFGDGTWSILDPETLQWDRFALPKGNLSGRLQVDSKGRLHNFFPGPDNFRYSISSDGMKSTNDLVVKLPKGFDNAGNGLHVDFRANAQLGIAAVAFHGRYTKTGVSGDLVYTIDISKNKPRLLRLYHIGLADTDASSGISASPHDDIRFDFETVALFPDGRIAVSFLDSTTAGIYHLAEPVTERIGPALAIELP